MMTCGGNSGSSRSSTTEVRQKSTRVSQAFQNLASACLKLNFAFFTGLNHDASFLAAGTRGRTAPPPMFPCGLGWLTWRWASTTDSMMRYASTSIICCL